MSEEINREQWRALCTQGDELDDQKVTVTARYIEVEADEGLVDVSVAARADGVDVRIHDLQVVVKGKSVVVMQQHPPYPISRWTILWKGDLV